MKLIQLHLHDDGGEELSIYNLEIHPDIIGLFIDHGILDAEKNFITAEELCNIRKIVRLRKALGVNTNGAAIIAGLLGRIEELEDEVRRLQLELGD